MADIIRAGMIGTDTSHAIVFTQMLHDEKHKHHVPGVRVVAAYPSFSPDIESSAGRVEQYKKELADRFGVQMTASIRELLERVDVILIESVDGRRHLPELEAVAAAGKPVYIDKPFAASLTDARKMAKLIQDHKLPCFSASSLRFDSNIRKAAADLEECGEIAGCDAFSAAHLEKTNPGLFWYGIHGVEILYTIMGRGCRVVQCASTPEGDLAVGTWSDGRIGTMRGIRKGQPTYGAVVLCTNRPPQFVQAAGDFYAGLLRDMVEFFRTRKPPVAIDETLEICAFIDAALRSSQTGGDDVRLDLGSPGPDSSAVVGSSPA